MNPRTCRRDNSMVELLWVQFLLSTLTQMASPSVSARAARIVTLVTTIIRGQVKRSVKKKFLFHECKQVFSVEGVRKLGL